jgi:hypothetical protein
MGQVDVVVSSWVRLFRGLTSVLLGKLKVRDLPSFSLDETAVKDKLGRAPQNWECRHISRQTENPSFSRSNT